MISLTTEKMEIDADDLLRLLRGEMKDIQRRVVNYKEICTRPTEKIWLSGYLAGARLAVNLYGAIVSYLNYERKRRMLQNERVTEECNR